MAFQKLDESVSRGDFLRVQTSGDFVETFRES